MVICEADKGHIAVICKRDTLVRLQREHIEAGIEDGTYTVVDNPTVAISCMTARWRLILGELRSCVNELRDIEHSSVHNYILFNYLKCSQSYLHMVFTPGVIHGSLKIHKPVISFRPIIDNSIKIGSNFESYILKVPNNIFQAINLYHVKNSYEVASILREEYAGLIYSCLRVSLWLPISKALPIVGSYGIFHGWELMAFLIRNQVSHTSLLMLLSRLLIIL